MRTFERWLLDIWARLAAVGTIEAPLPPFEQTLESEQRWSFERTRLDIWARWAMEDAIEAPLYRFKRAFLCE